MEPPGRCGDWLAPPPSPPRAHAPGRHDERGMGTFIWPPAGTYTWPSARTFPWPWTVLLTSLLATRPSTMTLELVRYLVSTTPQQRPSRRSIEARDGDRRIVMR